MTRRDKMRSRLVDLEERLVEILLPELDAAAGSGGQAVFAWLQPDHPILVQIIGVQGARPAVADLVEEIEALRKQFREPNEGTVTAWYRAACLECVDFKQHHRRGPKRLAAVLAQRIRASRRANST